MDSCDLQAGDDVSAPTRCPSGAPLLRRSVEAPELFSAFYREHAESVLKYFARRTLDPDAAVDLTAETFAQAYASRKRFRGNTEEEAGGWLYAIAKHQLAAYTRKGHLDLKALRKLGIERPPLADEDVERVEDLAGLADLRAATASGLAALPAGLREAVSLRVIEELPYPEVARRLQIEEHTARMRVSRGLRRLRASVLVPEQGTLSP